MSSFYARNFYPLASFCSWAGGFELLLVTNPEDSFFVTRLKYERSGFISLLVLRAGYGIWLYQFLIIAYLFTYHTTMEPKDGDRESNSAVPDKTASSGASWSGSVIFANVCLFQKVELLQQLTLQIKCNFFSLLEPTFVVTYMSRAMRKCVFYHRRTTKAQISLCIHAVWSAPLLFAA